MSSTAEAQHDTNVGRPNREDLDTASARLSGKVKRTAIMSSHSIDRAVGFELSFKCENFQTTGAFKFRGALNALLTLDDAQRSRGVATHSSGNHAAALACAASLLGCRAWVVMPCNANAAKRRAVVRYGAEVIDCGPSQDEREQAFRAVLDAHGAEPVPPFDDERVIAGQSTAARELLEDCGGLDALIAPVGGGGLLAGTCLSAHHLTSGVAVYGAEPAAADDTKRSFDAGRRLPLAAPPPTLADGLRTSVGEITFPIVRRHARGILTASESGIIDAMRMIWERMKIVVEPSAAVPLAAMLENPDALADHRRVGVILSGGNVDLDHLPW